MDGYTKAAIKEELAKRSQGKVKYDEFMELLTNGPAVYVFALLFYGFWGWVIWASLGV